MNKRWFQFTKFEFINYLKMRNLICILIFTPLIAFGQDSYKATFSVLKEGLEGKRHLSFNDAVFLVESSYEQIISKA